MPEYAFQQKKIPPCFQKQWHTPQLSFSDKADPVHIFKHDIKKQRNHNMTYKNKAKRTKQRFPTLSLRTLAAMSP